MGLLERTRNVATYMPIGFTEQEADAEATYWAHNGLKVPIDTDFEVFASEVTERTILGKLVDLGKRAITFTQRGEE